MTHLNEIRQNYRPVKKIKSTKSKDQIVLIMGGVHVNKRKLIWSMNFENFSTERTISTVVVLPVLSLFTLSLSYTF